MPLLIYFCFGKYENASFTYLWVIDIVSKSIIFSGYALP